MKYIVAILFVTLCGCSTISEGIHGELDKGVRIKLFSYKFGKGPKKFEDPRFEKAWRESRWSLSGSPKK